MPNLRLKKNHHIETEWDEWDKLAEKGYRFFGENKETEGLKCFREAWTVFEKIMEQYPEKVSVDELMEEQDYVYAVDGWLQDFEMELANGRCYEERIKFCQDILEMFDWEYDENESCFRCGIGDSYFYLGQTERAMEYYESWLKENPQNVNGINSYALILSEVGQTDKAYEILRRATWGVSCNMYNSILFIQAEQLAKETGKEAEEKWYSEQLEKCHKMLKEQESEDDIFDEFTAPAQVPVVKPAKIYPNDPCPCGSGKKYKKCCGKNQ